MKKLIIINGTMGVGKTTIVNQLYKQLDNSVWLDGDWCWLMNPWNITEYNKTMVMTNIHFMLNQYLDNPTFDYVFFTWVIHKESILEEILAGLQNKDFHLVMVTLTCSKDELVERMRKDNRSEQDIENSISRLKCYETMNTQKLNTSGLDLNGTVAKLLKMVVHDSQSKEIPS